MRTTKLQRISHPVQNRERSTFSKRAYKRLSEITNLPMGLLEPKVYHLTNPFKNAFCALFEKEKGERRLYRKALALRLLHVGYHERKSHKSVVFIPSKFVEEHEKIHSIHFLLSKNRESVEMGLKGSKKQERNRSLSEYTCTKRTHTKNEFYALAPLGEGRTAIYLGRTITLEVIGAAAVFAAAAIPVLAYYGEMFPSFLKVISKLKIPPLHELANFEQYMLYLKQYLPFMLKAAAGTLVASTAIIYFLARYFNRQCSKYGIDGYLAAFLYNINPFKARKKFQELEKEGIIKEGEGFTEKGKEKVLERKEDMISICKSKEI